MAEHEGFMRQCIAFAEEAARAGDEPLARCSSSMAWCA
jgi:hypothetical protein